MPVIPIDISYYINEENKSLYLELLRKRIDYLQDEREEYEDQGIAWAGDGADELRELVAFIGELRAAFNNIDNLTLVLEEDLESFLRREAEGQYGIGADNLGDYVNWTGYAEDLRRRDWSSATLGGRTILCRRDS
jgi:hypothetical protein